MYHRTYYQQLYYKWIDDISAVAYQPIQVYSNINGGLGIFAGMNETNYFFKAPEKPVRETKGGE